MKTTVKTEEVWEEVRRLYFEVAGVLGKLEGKEQERARLPLMEAHHDLAVAYENLRYSTR